MKVGDFIKRYQHGVSNAEISIKNTATANQDKVITLTKEQVKDIEPSEWMNLKVNSFQIINNEVLIYAQ